MFFKKEVVYVISKKRIIIAIISAICLFLAVLVILNYIGELEEALGYLKTANYWVLLLLIPNIIIMYYAAGRIWYPYLKHYGCNAKELAIIQYELNFVNAVVPSAAFSGMVYATKRLRPYGISAGKAGMFYWFRYVVSIGTNLFGMILAVLFLAITGKLTGLDIAPLLIAIFIAVGSVFAVIIIVVILAGKIKFKNEKVQKYTVEVQTALNEVKKDKPALLSSFAWGTIYTLFEDLPFLIVALAFGNPWIFFQMIVASAVGNLTVSIFPTPGGIGGFEAVMIWFMGSFDNISVSLSVIIVLICRVLIVVGTTITGYPFFQRGMVKIGKDLDSTPPKTKTQP